MHNHQLYMLFFIAAIAPIAFGLPLQRSISTATQNEEKPLAPHLDVHAQTCKRYVDEDLKNSAEYKEYQAEKKKIDAEQNKPENSDSDIVISTSENGEETDVTFYNPCDMM
ncbi:MAG: hypothetical protein M1820_010428 [Bogoriella megaspora]|nr:MAG: hypothetical protein M1820_010428 [Bogoriella megaspora]